VNCEEFLVEWFGPEGRELGCPERFYTRNPQDLVRLARESGKTLSPCYVSVQPYAGPNKPCALEKLYFDFDCRENPSRAWKDATVFMDAMRRFYAAEPLIVFSGCKGFHAYVFLKKLVYFEETLLPLAKQAYRELQVRLVEGLKLPTLDPQPVGDIKRLARVPFSFHEETSSLCAPVDTDKKPFVPESLDAYRTLDAELLAPIIKELKSREKLASIHLTTRRKHLTTRGIRPCIKAALSVPLEGKGGHLMRLAVAREHLAAGYSLEEIVQLLQAQPDYNPEKTRYHVQHAQKNPAKPFKCKTIRELGFCLTDCCRKHRR